MSVQNPPNPPRHAEIADRFSMLLRRHMVRLKLSDDGVLALIKKAGNVTKGSLSSIRRYKDARGGTPTPQTIGLYAEALSFTQAEIDSLIAPTTEGELKFISDLGLTEGLLRALAWEFGHEDSGASLAEYHQYLRDKASEYSALTTRLSALNDLDRRLENLTAATKAALGSGDFEEVDRLLSAAEDIQLQERTLQEVRRLAKLRASRGANALFRNDFDVALEHFLAAANYLTPFDPLKAARELTEFVTAVNVGNREEKGQREERFRVAVQASEIALRLSSRASAPQQWAQTRCQFGSTYAKYARGTNGEEAIGLLLAALAHQREALAALNPSEHPRDWAAHQFILGDALDSLGWHLSNDSWRTHMLEALTAFEAGLAIERSQSRRSLLSSGIVQEHAARIAEDLAEIGPVEERVGRLRQACAFWEEALDQWGSGSARYADCSAKYERCRTQLASLLSPRADME